MAELLVMAVSKGAAAGHWKRGDIVYIAPDGWNWGTHEFLGAWTAAGNSAATFPGNHVVIKVPGVSVAKLQHLKADLMTGGQMTGRSLWQVAVASLPANIKTLLQNTGTLTIGPGSGGDVSVAAAQNFIANLIDSTHPDLTP